MTRLRFYKPALVGLTILLLVSVFFSQRQLNHARAKLGLTRTDPLENAPPVLAFTTVALGGFRGLIANGLWVRAMELQDEGKYFEMVQLADWITKLQPHLTSVWVVQAWNMAYNISIKFRDYADRWLWVQAGIKLLRDEGMRYNPHETLMYRELAWFFQHKMGQNLDDAHLYFKQAWAKEMTEALGGAHPDYETLLNPKTEAEQAQVKLLREKYKLLPAVMKEVDDQYGPLDWRLPETHAIYWAMRGLKEASQKEFITLRRVIYQSMQLAFQRGSLMESKFGKVFTFSPNLDIIPNANKAYEDMMEQDPEQREHIKTGHRNFLRDAVYFLYTRNERPKALHWFKYLEKKYPDKPLLSIQTNSMPGQITLDDYALDRIAEDAGETSVDRTTSLLKGLLVSSYDNLAMGFDEKAVNYQAMAEKIRERFMSKIKGQEHRVGLDPLPVLQKQVLDQLLSTNSAYPPELQDQLRTALRLSTATNAPPVLPVSTNTTPGTVKTE